MLKLVARMSIFLQHYSLYLSVLYNYLDSPKLFLDLYLAKFLDISIESFFPVHMSYVRGAQFREYSRDYIWTHLIYIFITIYI